MRPTIRSFSRRHRGRASRGHQRAEAITGVPLVVRGRIESDWVLRRDWGASLPEGLEWLGRLIIAAACKSLLVNTDHPRAVSRHGHREKASCVAALTTHLNCAAIRGGTSDKHAHATTPHLAGEQNAEFK